ncbi:MAG TPA: serpin family protein [Verrucomicrobiae bacterium]|nr:serpin family protein [Verrucomicrobiae bacterium]
MQRSKISLRLTWLSLWLCATSLPALAGSAEDQTRLTAANSGFAFDLFQQIIQEQPDTNLFISPFSVSMVLQMMANGAAGATKQELDRVLHTDVLPIGALNAAGEGLNQSLKSQTNVILELANAFWYQQGISLKPGFVSVNREFFQAELGAVDFARPSSAQTINHWADQRTHGKIQDIVRWPFAPATRVVLANAIYFKGKWERPFDKQETRPHAFHPAGGGEKEVPTMRRHGRFAYQRSDGFQAVQLPYAGGRLCLDVYLPDADSSLAKLLARFNATSERGKMLEGFLEQDGTLALPRFKLEYDIRLNEPLQALGLKRAFRGGDFSAMSDESLEVSEVRQKSYVEVNEEGTEAAAVTVGMMRATAVFRPEKPFEMIVDRPFFFVIKDNQTKSVLFMGVVSDPSI